MLKSILIYAAILAAVFILRFALVALVSYLEEKLQARTKPAPPFLIPLLISVLMFVSGVLTVAQFAVPILWILSRWDIPSAIVLTLSILIAVFVGTHMSFKALCEMQKYGTIKPLHVISAVLFILYMDCLINAACSAFVMGFGFPEIVRMVMNVVIFTLYVIYVIVLLIRSFKSFSY